MKKETKQVKLESGDMAIVLLEKTMAIYNKKKLLVEITKDQARDLMLCFFDMMNLAESQERARIKGKRKPKTSKHAKK